MNKRLAKKINFHLKDFNYKIRTNKKFKFLPIFIVGLPRSGSTFFHQILISKFNFNYVSNIKAFFYENVVLGNLLHNKLSLDTNFKSNFISRFGNTFGPLEPNEWGWFWRKWFNLKNNEHHISRKVDWKNLKKELLKIDSINKSPLLFDTPFINGNLDKFISNISPVLIFNLERVHTSVYKSLLNARIKKYGTLNKYYGAHTKGNKILNIRNPYNQVFQQVKTLHQEKEDMLRLVAKDNICAINYEDLVKEPMKEIKKIQRFLKKQNILIAVNNITLPKFINRNSIPLKSDYLNNDYKKYYKYIKNRWLKN